MEELTRTMYHQTMTLWAELTGSQHHRSLLLLDTPTVQQKSECLHAQLTYQPVTQTQADNALGLHVIQSRSLAYAVPVARVALCSTFHSNKTPT